MSRANPNRMLAALNDVMRKVSGQGVLYSQLVAQRLGVNSTDLECLDVIVMRGSVTAGEIAAATGLTTGAVTGVVDRLEKAGYARRERDEADRRKVFVRALPAVQRRIMPLFEPMAAATNAAISSYSEKELVLILEFLTRTHEAAIAATEALQGKGPAKPTRRTRS